MRIVSSDLFSGLPRSPCFMRHLVVAGAGRGLSDLAIDLGTWTLTFQALLDPSSAAAFCPGACAARPSARAPRFLRPEKCRFRNPKQNPRSLRGQEAVGRNHQFTNEGRRDAGDPADGPHRSSVGLRSVPRLQTDSVRPGRRAGAGALLGPSVLVSGPAGGVGHVLGGLCMERVAEKESSVL